MPEQSNYGEQFLKHLAAIGKQTPFHYKDLQQIKAMDCEQLGNLLKTECPQIAEIIMSKSPAEVAEVIQKKRLERAAAVSRGSAAQGAASLLEFVVQLFAATV